MKIIAQVKVRGALVAVVLKKNLQLSLSTVKESAALTLMSTDVDGIILSTSQMYDIVAAPIELAVAFYLLWREVGAAFFLPIVTVIRQSSSILPLILASPNSRFYYSYVGQFPFSSLANE